MSTYFGDLQKQVLRLLIDASVARASSSVQEGGVDSRWVIESGSDRVALTIKASSVKCLQTFLWGYLAENRYIIDERSRRIAEYPSDKSFAGEFSRLVTALVSETEDYVQKNHKCKSGVDLSFYTKGNCAVGNHEHWQLLTESTIEKITKQRGHTRKSSRAARRKVVEGVRYKVSDHIESSCGWVRVLDMTRPVALKEVFTEVNILEEISGRRRLTIPQLLEISRLENFDLIGRDFVRQSRVSGLESVKQHQKLLVFGKPGSGKTTFLKHIAILCNRGLFQSNCVPFFIALKDFAEEVEKPSLLQYMAARLAECDVKDAEQTLDGLLQQGQVLVLLDALDEVRKVDISRVLKQIRKLSYQFPQCHYVITCRIASRPYVFEQFTEVEMADFSDEQIEAFATNWFQAQNSADKTELFLQKLQDNKSILELATNPLMLTLLCLVFAENANFPESRFELYEEGLDIWLKKWDDTRNIERDKIYKNLSYKRKKDLLSYVAFHTFKENKFFVRQVNIEQIIAEYVQHLSPTISRPQGPSPDSEVFLEAIELQHGLLVKRAKNIYSFSHLTFHEYLTARQIAHAQDPHYIETLSLHITDPIWHEVFLLTVSMLQNADTLIQLMKQQIDSLITADPALERFLVWVNSKAQSTQSPYDSAAIRAYYLSSANVLCRTSKLILNLDLALAIDENFIDALDSDPDIALDRALVLLLDTISCLLPMHSQESEPIVVSDVIHDFLIVLKHKVIPTSFFELQMAAPVCEDVIADNSIAYALSVVLGRVLDKAENSEMRNLLELIVGEALEQCCDVEKTRHWLEQRGCQWIDELRTFMKQYRNIGYIWQFSDKQKELLQQYADANKLLLECISKDCYLTRSLREQVLASLLSTSQVSALQPTLIEVH